MARIDLEPHSVRLL